MNNKNNTKMYFFGMTVMAFFVISCATNTATDNKSSTKPEVINEKPVVEEVNPPAAIVEPVFTPETFLEELQEMLKSNNMKEALNSFNEIPDEYSDNQNLRYIHASLLLSAGKTDEAEVITNDLLEKDPENLDVINLAMYIAKVKGDSLKKQSLLKKVLEKDPDNATANIEKGNSLMLTKNYKLARQYYGVAVQSDPENEEALFDYGQTSYYLDDLDVAKTFFERVLALNKDNGFAWSYLGKLYAESEDYKAAIPCAQKATDIQPEYYHHWIELSNYYRLTGKFDEAIDALNHATAINPEYFLAYIYRAGLNDQIGERAKALDDYLNVVKYKPDYYFAYESIGTLAWGEKDWEKARQGFQKAYEAKPDNVSYALMIAATYLKQDKKNECKEFMGKALKKLDRSSIEYSVARLYWDNLADQSVLLKVTKLESATDRGKYMFYMALWYELQGYDSLAQKYYIYVDEMKAPMFFEYRLCEWALEQNAN